VSGFDPPLTVIEVQAAVGSAYRINTSLQIGGQGAVFQAEVQPQGTTVALKVYHPDQLEERLEREIDALRAIRSPTLVQLHDAGSCEIRGQQCRYLATTFIDGQPLDAVLKAGGAQPLARVARVGHDIALAIETIWTARIVHRDIKPNNVMLTATGGAVLIDLGVARHLDMTSLTTTGKTWGTSGYLSPEQCRAAPLTCKSDVFALGILVQECILGRHPTGTRQASLLGGGVKTDGLRTGLPRFLVHLVDAMVHQKAVMRPSPAKVAAGLAQLAGIAKGNQ
jgi:serine/threonine protein kinase